MTQHLETQQWVPYPVELVFAFFANPANLPHLMPRSRTRASSRLRRGRYRMIFRGDSKA
jgi:hypothetical protein